MGVQEPDQLARHIWRSRGPSGENKEYLFLLEEALEGLGVGSGDEHVRDLAERTRGLAVTRAEGSGKGLDGGQATEENAVENERARSGSGVACHGQEEMQKSAY